MTESQPVCLPGRSLCMPLVFMFGIFKRVPGYKRFDAGFTGVNKQPRCLVGFVGLFEELVHQFPQTTKSDDADLQFRLGVVLARSGQFRNALPHVVNAVGEAAAHYNLGLIYHERAVDYSRNQFTLALQKGPDLVEAREWLDWLNSADFAEVPIVVRDTDSPEIVPAWKYTSRPEAAVRRFMAWRSLSSAAYYAVLWPRRTSFVLCRRHPASQLRPQYFVNCSGRCQNRV